jgi:amino acid transporter
VLVSIGVIVLRRTRPDLPRAFQVPLMPVVPIVSALACFWLMLNLPGDTWLRFLVWMALGVLIYFAYSRRRSRVGHRGRTGGHRRRERRAALLTPPSPPRVNPHARVYSDRRNGPT